MDDLRTLEHAYRDSLERGVSPDEPMMRARHAEIDAQRHLVSYAIQRQTISTYRWLLVVSLVAAVASVASLLRH